MIYLKSGDVIDGMTALGAFIRERRKAQGLAQADLAAMCGVGPRFLSELENGAKDSFAFGKVLDVLQGLGVDFVLNPRGE
jgi:HTH-type transcriptional regulator/antitoxin HipB